MVAHIKRLDNRLQGLAKKFTPDYHDRNDLVQETLYRILKSNTEESEEELNSHPISYYRQVMYSIHVNNIRKIKGRRGTRKSKEISLESIEREGESQGNPMREKQKKYDFLSDTKTKQPLEAIELQEDKERITKVARNHSILTLRYGRELSYDNIAKAMSIPPNIVKSRISRTKCKYLPEEIATQAA